MVHHGSETLQDAQPGAEGAAQQCWGTPCPAGAKGLFHSQPSAMKRLHFVEGVFRFKELSFSALTNRNCGKLLITALKPLINGNGSHYKAARLFCISSACICMALHVLLHPSTSAWCSPSCTSLPAVWRVHHHLPQCSTHLSTSLLVWCKTWSLNTRRGEQTTHVANLPRERAKISHFQLLYFVQQLIVATLQKLT